MPKTEEEMIEACRVPPGKEIDLDDYDPAWAGDRKIAKADRKAFAEKVLSEEITSLAAAQELLYAAHSWSVLVILQALDAAGKDGTIKHVMSGVNPQGCQVSSFKQPTAEELAHDFLWRYTQRLPARGQIGIFNRSYYEDVLIVKVHPELLTAAHLPEDQHKKKFWKARYEDINNFERHLARNGTKIFKFFLHLSKDEQRQRFLARVNDPNKHWKFSPADLAEREYWDDYTRAYEDCLSATSTDEAPWYVLPADHKWVTRALTATIITRGIESLGLKYPEVSDDLRRQIDEARRQLEAEGA